MIFSKEDYQRMFEKYCSTSNSELMIQKIEGKAFHQLQRAAHEHGISVNSLVLTGSSAFMDKKESLGIAVDMRPENIAGMGNFATGVSVEADYSEAESFWRNAKRLHENIQKKLEKSRDLCFLSDFMGELDQTLVDSMWFVRYGEYKNPVSDAVCKMCGYVENPVGISTTNLKMIEMPDAPEWKYRYEELFFVPPYIPNVRSVIGFSSFADAMTLVLHTAQGRRTMNEQKAFEQAVQLLIEKVKCFA